MMTAKHTRHSRRSCFVISAEGGCDELSPGTAGSSAEQDARAEQWSEAEKIAGSDFSRAKRARRARIRDDTRKSSLNMRPAELDTTAAKPRRSIRE